MAQTVDLWGATYSNVPAIEVPSGNSTVKFDDTTDANATAGDIASGKTAYVNGVKLTGTGSTGGASNWLDGSATGSVRTVGSAAEDSNYTIGAEAVAEGHLTKASGSASHTEGSATTASGNNAHAEGQGSEASNWGAHAEGSYTTASGLYSHSEGQRTTASGNMSHAEGDYTVANHRTQHVFGAYNIADASEAAASARGNYVEIVGNGTATDARSNARTLDWDGNEVLAGKLTVGTAPSNNMDVATKQYVDSSIPDISTKSDATNWLNGSATGSLRAIGSAAEDENYTIGEYAVAEGDRTKASGNKSHAEGQLTTASGAGAHAEGGNTTASGQLSHAEGGNTTASASQAHAEGAYTTASAINSHSEGQRTVASGSMSHAEGDYTIANHRTQHVFGGYNVADPSAEAATARGTYVEIVGNGYKENNVEYRSNARTLDWDGNEVLAGKLTVGTAPTNNMDVATKQYVDNSIPDISTKSNATNWLNGSATGSVRTVGSAAEDANYTMGTNAVAEGSETKASGVESHAEGYQTVASNYESHAEGSGTTASGIHAHAEGRLTVASGENSHAEGQNTTASEVNAHAEGAATTASGRYSHVEGMYTIANHHSQHVFGQYNIADPSAAAASAKGNYVEIVGNGTANNARSNARTLDWDGNETLSGTLTLKKGSADEATINPKYLMANVTLGTETTLVDTTTVSFSKDGDNTWYVSGANPISGFTTSSFAYDTLYKIIWDGVESEEFYYLIHEYTTSGSTTSPYTIKSIGNADIIGYNTPYTNPGNCLITYNQGRGSTVKIYTSSTDSTHTIKIVSVPYTKHIVNKQYYEEVFDGKPLIQYGGNGAVLTGYALAASGEASLAEGYGTRATGEGSHAEGEYNIASGRGSHVEGTDNKATNLASHAEGRLCEANARCSHAEGYMRKTTSNGYGAHAEGAGTTSSGDFGSHAEGLGGSATARASHVEGLYSSASGSASHAEGNNTIANHLSQHVFGEYNVSDSSAAAASARGNYVEIVGNGTANDARSNARTLDWSGNEVLAGKLTLGAGPTANMDAVTKQYMEAQGYLTLATLPIYDGTVNSGGVN